MGESTTERRRRFTPLANLRSRVVLWLDPSRTAHNNRGSSIVSERCDREIIWLDRCLSSLRLRDALGEGVV
jgi:hypothetical protein